jgi:hypothetical protein
VFGFSAHQQFRSYGAETGKMILGNLGRYKLQRNASGQNQDILFISDINNHEEDIIVLLEFIFIHYNSFGYHIHFIKFCYCISEMYCRNN